MVLSRSAGRGRRKPLQPALWASLALREFGRSRRALLLRGKGKGKSIHDETASWMDSKRECIKPGDQREGAHRKFQSLLSRVGQHAGQQRGSGREVLDEHRLVPRVRAFAHRAHAVERGNAERRGEIAVGSAAGGGFVQLEAEFARRAPALCGRAGRFRGCAPWAGG